jgi:hypothetical protein
MAVEQTLLCEDLLCHILAFVDGKTKFTELQAVSKVWNRALHRAASWVGINIDKSYDDQPNQTKVLEWLHANKLNDKLSQFKNSSCNVDFDLDCLKLLKKHVELGGSKVPFRLQYHIKLESYFELCEAGQLFEELWLNYDMYNESKFEEEHKAQLVGPKLRCLKLENVNLLCLTDLQPALQYGDSLTAQLTPITAQLTSLKLCHVMIPSHEEYVPDLGQLRDFEFTVMSYDTTTKIEDLDCWLAAAPQLVNLTIDCYISLNDGQKLTDVLPSLLKLNKLRTLHISTIRYSGDNDTFAVVLLNDLIQQLSPTLDDLSIRSHNKVQDMCLLQWQRQYYGYELNYMGCISYLANLDPSQLPPFDYWHISNYCCTIRSLEQLTPVLQLEKPIRKLDLIFTDYYPVLGSLMTSLETLKLTHLELTLGILVEAADDKILTLDDIAPLLKLGNIAKLQLNMSVKPCNFSERELRMLLSTMTNDWQLTAKLLAFA